MFHPKIHLFDIIYFLYKGPYVSDPIFIVTINQKSLYKQKFNC
jgi:hypothetical protein